MIEEIIRLLLEEQRKVETSAMRYPDPASYDRWVGKHQGLALALEIVEEVLKGKEED